jgi:hypothetical protein
LPERGFSDVEMYNRKYIEIFRKQTGTHGKTKLTQKIEDKTNESIYDNLKLAQKHMLKAKN